MKHIKIRAILIIIALVSIFMMTTAGMAAAADDCHPESAHPPGKALTPDQLKSCVACNNNPGLKDCLKNNLIIKRLQQIIDFLSAGVGIVVVATIIVGGIKYSIAGDSPQKLTAAKQRISNGLIALLTFMFIFGFVQWLIPGGIFS